MKSKRFTFKGFNWKKLLLGAKRPAIATIATLIALIAVKPQWAWVAGLSAGVAGLSAGVAGLSAGVAGLSAERIWATVEFYCQK